MENRGAKIVKQVKIVNLPADLLARVKDGNAKLNAAWMIACNVAADPVAFDEQLHRIAVSWPRLDVLCQELMLEGYSQCLYQANDPDRRQCFEKDGRFCFVCPRMRKIED